jgi:hypothetical protein
MLYSIVKGSNFFLSGRTFLFLANPAGQFCPALAAPLKKKSLGPSLRFSHLWGMLLSKTSRHNRKLLHKHILGYSQEKWSEEEEKNEIFCYNYTRRV